MAKIYETDQDKKRDDIARHRDVGAAISGAGLSTLLFSAFTAVFSFLGKRFIPENAKNLFGGSMRKGMENMGWFAIGMTAASGASAFAGNMIKKQAQAELDKLGPETVILPPGIGETKENCGCPLKPYAQAVGTKTLIDQAAKAEGSALGKE